MSTDSTQPSEAQVDAVAKVADLISTLVRRFMSTGWTFQEAMAMAEVAMRQSLSRAAQLEAQAKQA